MDHPPTHTPHTTLRGSNLSSTMTSQLTEFQECLRRSKRIVALVGAGLSAALGLATFRGSQGLWKNFNMIDLATPDAFYIDPGLVWQFYLWRRHQLLQAQPNAGHVALARLSRLPSKRTLTINQNVDGLLARAGHDPSSLHEIHGSLFELRCTSFTCTHVERGNVDDPLTPALEVTPEYADTDTPSAPLASPHFTPTKELRVDQLPQCPVCRSLMRPGVVWFGESLSLRVLDRIDTFLEAAPVDLILVIGTSGTVYPANSYVDLVRLRGGSVAIFNTDIDTAVLDGSIPNTWGFQGDAAEWLPIALGPAIADVPL